MASAQHGRWRTGGTTDNTTGSVPPFSALVKVPEVEDPINRWMHRPLAYAFVRAIYHTRLTPNGVTFLAMTVGVTAGAMWAWGTAEALVAGGILLWTSAILDGADGILARAKNQQSQYGRALDGAADMVVAGATVFPAAAWAWSQLGGGALVATLCVAAIVTAVVHVELYDFYKESFLRLTQPERGGEGEDSADVERRLTELEARGGPLLTRIAVRHVLLPFVRRARALVSITNPAALRDGVRFVVNSQTATIYKKHNAAPMKVWAAISLAPHSYLLAICGMLGRFDVYLGIRLILMNVLCVVVVVWQRVATKRTLSELGAIGASPVRAH